MMMKDKPIEPRFTMLKDMPMHWRMLKDIAMHCTMLKVGWAKLPMPY